MAIRICEICLKHGMGKYWFKWASRYARETYFRKRTENRARVSGSLEGQVAALAFQAMEAKNLRPKKYPEMIK